MSNNEEGYYEDPSDCPVCNSATCTASHAEPLGALEPVTVKGREMYLVIGGHRYDYNGVHDWEQFSFWFFDSLLDYESKQRGEPLGKCPNCGGRHFINKSDSGLLKENESKCLKCGGKYIDL